MVQEVTQRRRGRILTVVAATACMSGRADSETPHAILTDSALPVLGQTVEVSDKRSDGPLLPGSIKWEGTIFAPQGAGFVRVHVFFRGASRGGWSIDVFDATDARADEFRWQDLTPNGTGRAAWSKRIPGSTARVRLVSATALPNIVVGIDKYIYDFRTPAIENFIGGHDDREDLVTAYGKEHPYYRWGRPVAELTFVSAQSQKETNCTAFLVAPTLLLTNAHCISQTWQVRTAAAVFGFETDSTDAVSVPLSALLLTSRELDFSLMRITRQVPTFGTVNIGATPVDNQQLVLIQQPNGGHKLIAVRKCRVQSAIAPGISGRRNTDFFHLCDTEGGSSGSPVMDAATGAVVGLHQAGVWDPKAGDYHNLGVKITEIVQHMAKCDKTTCQEVGACQQALEQHTKGGATCAER